jgi:hypothetical protein
MRHEPARVENRSDRRRGCDELDAVAESAEFPDHLARADLLGFHADGRPRFVVAHALMQDLADQSTQPVCDGVDRLGMTGARDEPTVHDREDCSLGLHRPTSPVAEIVPDTTPALLSAIKTSDQ